MPDFIFNRKSKEETLEITITYLELRHRSRNDLSHTHQENITVLKADRPTLSYYRYLYNHIGERWLWYERRFLDDESLLAIIHHPAVSIYVLYFNGVPAGYIELDDRTGHEMKIGYFGLLPDFIGQGLGSWLLNWGINTAWESKPSRISVNTCTLDHPNALSCYENAGFKVYRQETMRIKDPRCVPAWSLPYS